MDNIGKRCLHAFFGAIVGAGAGWYLGLPEDILIGAVIGMISGGIAAFLFADKFWEALRDIF